MKKTILFAALAVVAMASCTKNELKVPSTGSDAVISFQPVVANATKATYLTTANMATACTEFGVFAWYAEPSLSAASAAPAASTVTAYMSNVKVTYDSTIGDDTQGNGAWKPASPYYWPKNGTLSFDAYAPASAHADNPGNGTGKVKSNATSGLEIRNYTVADLDDQYDLLYSTRTLDKNKSTDGTNITYDGVDITFKHALAAIEVTAKTDEDYSDAIKLTKITILNAYSTGEFFQNMTNAVSEGTPGWTLTANEVDYVLFNQPNGVALKYNETLSSSSTSNPISRAILLPQSLEHNSKKVSIKVDYTIKCDGGDLAQTQTFELTPRSGTEESGSPTSLTAWEIGKRYTYNFIFSLDKIYFAPSVENWTAVTVNDINVK